MSAEAEASAEQRKKRPAAKQPGTAIILCEYDGLGRVVKETVNTVPETVLYYEYDARGNVTKFTDAAGTVFKRIYTKTDLLKEEKVYAKGNTSETPDETRTYSYDEGGALKSVSDGDNTVYYNGADSEYQPDAYGKTRKEKWSRTGFEMSYDYDSLNRLTSVTTPDNKTESYTYNKNSQVSAIEGLIKGTLSYNKSRFEAVSLNNGLKKTFSYNEAGLISDISYSSDKNAALKTGFEYIYDKNFNITDRIHKDTKEKDTFTYDGLNRLVTSSLKGKFSNDTYEQFNLFNMKEIDRDIDGMASETKATLNGKLFPADKVTLDEKGKSFVYDFKEEKEIQKIELFKTNLEKTSRIRERDLHIYTKQNEADGWSELTPDNWNYVVDPKNQSIHFNLKTSLKTRFIKIRTIWDDRDIDNNNVSDYVTFSNESVQKMIRIWTLENERNEAYKYDGNSNRKIITENGKNRSYTYYKNDKNCNTARVMSDGKWWYTYDKNGNRTARARTATQNDNEVSLSKTGEYWEYTWDYHNRLVKVQQFNAPDNAQNVKVEYTYDAMNRKIERVSYTSETSVKTQYAYGRNGALTYQKKTEGNSVTYRSFVYLNNQIAGFMDTENGTEKIRYTVTDIQGSVTEVYDENGGLVWKSGYTAFGIKAGETTNLIDFGGLYTGCDFDTETGLTYHWNRWRGEDGDSWLSEDPARDGSNWYGYAGQNPTNFIDPNGLAPYVNGIYDGDYNPDYTPESQIEEGPQLPAYPTNNTPQNQSMTGEPTRQNSNPNAPNANPNDKSAEPSRLFNLENDNANYLRISNINGKNILLVNINDKSGLELAMNSYFGVLKYGVAGNVTVDTIAITDNNGNVIHIFSNDSSIKQYAAVINPFTGNFIDVLKSISTTTSTMTGIGNDLFDIPYLGKISTVTGLFPYGMDINNLFRNPSLSNFTDVIIDTYGFSNPIKAFLFAETKTFVEETTKDFITIENAYFKQKMINKFNLEEERKVDYGQFFMDEIHRFLGGKN